MKTKNDPIEFNKVSQTRHLDLNKLMKESFSKPKKTKKSKSKKNKKKQ